MGPIRLIVQTPEDLNCLWYLGQILGINLISHGATIEPNDNQLAEQWLIYLRQLLSEYTSIPQDIFHNSQLKRELQNIWEGWLEHRITALTENKRPTGLGDELRMWLRSTRGIIDTWLFEETLVFLEGWWGSLFGGKIAAIFWEQEVSKKLLETPGILSNHQIHFADIVGTEDSFVVQNSYIILGVCAILKNRN